LDEEGGVEHSGDCAWVRNDKSPININTIEKLFFIIEKLMVGKKLIMFNREVA
jgi:hypothetical protein